MANESGDDGGGAGGGGGGAAAAAASSVVVEVKNLRFTYPGIDGHPPPGSAPLIDGFSLALRAGDRCLLVGSNGAGKTTILKILGGKHMVDPDMVRVLGRSAFHDVALTASGDLSYLGGEILDIDLSWRMHKVSDGQRRRVQICMGLLKPFKVLLLDEITVDLDVLARANLLRYLRKECEERGAVIIYATHIFDGLDDWPSHVVYVAHGNLQLALPLEKVKEMSNLSLMRTVESWLRKEKEENRKRRKERKAMGLAEYDKSVEGSRVVGDPARSAARVMNNGWAAGRLHSTVAGEENFLFSSNSVLRQ
ncbi:ABC transporter I family member 20 [Ananas comosus]|uniref:ABC transporter I family member 20 n=1 Tax=Ananas comosus TaxID=4615 RepID=A0A199V870_ANACO|nr:ABC transporter I family member 20 [Ananas comosus]